MSLVWLKLTLLVAQQQKIDGLNHCLLKIAEKQLSANRNGNIRVFCLQIYFIKWTTWYHDLHSLVCLKYKWAHKTLVGLCTIVMDVSTTSKYNYFFCHSGLTGIWLKSQIRIFNWWSWVGMKLLQLTVCSSTCSRMMALIIVKSKFCSPHLIYKRLY